MSPELESGSGTFKRTGLLLFFIVLLTGAFVYWANHSEDPWSAFGRLASFMWQGRPVAPAAAPNAGAAVPSPGPDVAHPNERECTAALVALALCTRR
jgi:hypothetical protein